MRESLPAATITKVLRNHSVNYRFNEGRLEAEEVFTKDGEVFSEWTNVMSYTMRELKLWLGY